MAGEGAGERGRECHEDHYATYGTGQTARSWRSDKHNKVWRREDYYHILPGLPLSRYEEFKECHFVTLLLNFSSIHTIWLSDKRGNWDIFFFQRSKMFTPAVGRTLQCQHFGLSKPCLFKLTKPLYV